jgi:hypothetical protein
MKKNSGKFIIILTVTLAVLVAGLHHSVQAAICGTYWTSADSVLDENGISLLLDVAYGNGQFVATVSFPGGFLTSPNGYNWIPVGLFGTQIYNDITWGGNQYIAVKRKDYIGPAIRTSPDGVTWTGHDPEIPGASDLYSVAWNGNLYVAVGGIGDYVSLVAYSEDGKSWDYKTFNLGMLKSVTWNGNQFVAVGESPYISGYFINAPILTSPDGVNWTARDSGTEQDLLSVTWGGERFVAVGKGSLGLTDIEAVILTSPDGVSWTWRQSGTTEDLFSVTYGANQFIAVGNHGTILTSSDGVNWTAQDSGTTEMLKGVVWGEDRYVAVGATILVDDQCETPADAAPTDTPQPTDNNDSSNGGTGGGGGGGCFIGGLLY